jgi:cytochrome c553
VKYFFLVFTSVVILVIGIFGVRGQKFSRPPIRIFPDMDEQDEVKAQAPDDFFADGMGDRMPVAGTRPRGLSPDGAEKLGGIPVFGFGGGTGYCETGKIGDAYGNGMPEELGLAKENIGGFLRRGQERFGIYCSRCHGESGDGHGITSRFGVPVDLNPNANLAGLSPAAYPQGQMFETITKGKGNMRPYADNIPVRDRWAIIAYIRALQIARHAPYEEVKDAYEQATSK